VEHPFEDPHGFQRNRENRMSTILRWFYVDGKRHRAYFREAVGGSRELVVAGPDWQTSISNVPVAGLDDFAETELEDLAATARRHDTGAGE
jgi:hypothetical protein